jgi:hypothetical protein
MEIEVDAAEAGRVRRYILLPARRPRSSIEIMRPRVSSLEQRPDRERRAIATHETIGGYARREKPPRVRLFP